MIRRNRIVLAIASFGLAVGLGYAIRAAASGIPSTNALSYAGVLEDANGPITGSHNIQVLLYDAATAGNSLCLTTTASLVITNGRFSVQLPDACTTAVGATCSAGVCTGGNPNVWVDVLVDGSDTGRTKIGAVPYAVEANHTPNADNATTAATANAAGGALATTLSTIQGEVHTASAFRAELTTATTATTIPSNLNTQVIFNNVLFDLGTEYNPTTGVFTPKNAGTYLLTCGFQWTAMTAADFGAALIKGSGSAATYLEGVTINTTGYARPLVAMIVQLAASDTVTCDAYQAESSSYAFWANTPDRDVFSAARLY